MAGGVVLLEGVREEWRDVPGYEGFYSISSLGRLYSHPRPSKNARRKNYGGGFLKGTTRHRRGYVWVALTRDNAQKLIQLHRLVLLTFVGPCPEGLQACHNNDVKADNRLSNLRWDTPLANAVDRTANGNYAHGARVSGARLTESNVREAVRLKIGGSRNCDIARKFNVSNETVCCIFQRRTWKHLDIPKFPRGDRTYLKGATDAPEQPRISQEMHAWLERANRMEAARAAPPCPACVNGVLNNEPCAECDGEGRILNG
jgi:hypothetical protein